VGSTIADGLGEIRGPRRTLLLAPVSDLIPNTFRRRLSGKRLLPMRPVISASPEAE